MVNLTPDSFIRGLTARLEPPVRTHLKNVYTSVALSTLLAAVGGYVHLFTSVLSGGILSFIATIACLVALIATPDNGKNRLIRFSFMGGFAFCTGLNLGPLLEMSLRVDNTLIPTAFLLSSVVFACFSLSSLYAERAQWLYLGGTLSSALSVMMLLSLANLLFRSRLLFQIQIYGGLVLFCGFILYDTQLIVERRRHGDRDYIWHSIMLFVDFVDIFRHILIILTQKAENNKKRN